MDAEPNSTATTPWSDELADLYLRHFDRLVDQVDRQFRDRDLAEDAVQDAFLTFHSRGCEPAPGSELAYLATMARNRALQVLRTAHRRCRILRDNNVGVVHAPSAEVETLRGQQARSIVDDIATLPAQQGLAFVLRHVGGLSVSETADRLGVSSGTVKTHTHRAVRSMRRSQKSAAHAA